MVGGWGVGNLPRGYSQPLQFCQGQTPPEVHEDGCIEELGGEGTFWQKMCSVCFSMAGSEGDSEKLSQAPPGPQ